MNRPRYTRKDKAHEPTRDDLRSDGYVVIDVADLPGHPRYNPLDLFVIRPVLLKPVIVACSADGVKRWFAEHPDQPIVQVEVKNDAFTPLTSNEEEYFRLLGIEQVEIYV